jgi:hypothetical protein
MSDGNRPYGDCYQASLASAEELMQIKLLVEAEESAPEDIKAIYDKLDLTRPVSVVHGTVIPREGLDEGRTIVHAWLEVGDLVIETSNKQMLFIPSRDFYAVHEAIPAKRYSVAEARSLANRYGYCAWHLSDVS